jgi:hypothetical protein
MVDTPMARPKKQPDAPHQTTGSPDAAQPEAKENGREGGVRVNKMDLVRKALKRLGSDAKPKRIQGYLLKRYRVEISADVISNYKGSILKKAAAQSSVTRQPDVVGSTPANPERASNGGISVDDVRAVKSLADKIGAGKVQELVDVLFQ